MLVIFQRHKRQKKKEELMSMGFFLVLMHLLAASTVIILVAVVPDVATANALSRNDFPPHFLFGASTSAYQVSPFLLFFFLSNTHTHTHAHGVCHVGAEELFRSNLDKFLRKHF